jgi:hypothetical protein
MPKNCANPQQGTPIATTNPTVHRIFLRPARRQFPYRLGESPTGTLSVTQTSKIFKLNPSIHMQPIRTTPQGRFSGSVCHAEGGAGAFACQPRSYRREMQQSGLNLARFLKKPRLVSAKRLQKRAKFWPAAWR